MVELFRPEEPGVGLARDTALDGIGDVGEQAGVETVGLGDALGEQRVEGGAEGGVRKRTSYGGIGAGRGRGGRFAGGGATGFSARGAAVTSAGSAGVRRSGACWGGCNSPGGGAPPSGSVETAEAASATVSAAGWSAIRDCGASIGSGAAGSADPRRPFPDRRRA